MNYRENPETNPDSLNHREIGCGKNLLILDTCVFSNGVYETMLMRKNGEEIASRRTMDIEQAVFEDFPELEKMQNEIACRPENLTTNQKKLIDALKKAIAAGESAVRVNPYDDGTCNLDSPVINIKSLHMSKPAADVCFLAANLKGFYFTWFKDKCYSLPVPMGGQASTRTVAAEAMADSLRNSGYSSSVYYQMD